MRNSFVVLLGVLLSRGLTYAEDAGKYKNAITIDALSFMTRTLSVSYSCQIGDKYEIRVNPQVSFSGREDNMVLGLFSIDDPYWYYDTYGLQTGVSRLVYKRLYVEPMVYYKYGAFSSKEIKLSESEGDQFDEYWTLSRLYHSGGIALQSGLRWDKGHFRFSLYYGLGYHLRYYTEAIDEKRNWNTLIPGDYPVKSNYWKDGVSVYLGIRIGGRF